ncbi:MAG TPA: maltose ABC transporter substrate-binding protein [Ruminococcaceae bacterium]|jgi:arabinogalactan oligomer/maltooligosaccharide transport system substrate-binding protein|nr:extracellular solute-binding protein [Oscillospiraceae bacterium]HCM24234.1 maltose ABC transporter substrate-binding protein [Oscillospiraceae bacterium]
MKRKILSAALPGLLAVTTLLSGCTFSAGGPATSSAKAAESSQTSAQKQSITVWTNLENETKTLQEYGKKWEQETGNTVNVVHQTPDLQKFTQAAKSADGPDGVYGMANDQLASYISAGLVQEVPNGTFQESDYSPAAVQACCANGKQYALPIAVETNALFYNTKKIQKAPVTWDELIAQAKKNGGIKFEATSIYYDLGFLRAYNSYIFKYSNNKYDTQDIGLGNDGAVKAYQFIKSLADDKFLTANVTSDLSKSSFQSGETAFYIGGPWDTDGFKSANVPYAVAPMPKLNGKNFVTPVGTQVGFVSAKSQKQAAVWNFYEYLAKNAVSDLYKAGGRIPAQLAAQKKIASDNTTKAFITQISYGESMPTAAELGQVWTPYSDNMKLLLKGSISAQSAAKNIEKQVKNGISLMNSGK